VKRGGSLAPANEVFDILIQYGSPFLFDAGVSLANLTYPSPSTSRLITFLPKLRFLKSTKYYPWMFVSKILHFANPSLFPMWDQEVIQGKVMGGKSAAFHCEYKTFCRDHWFSVWENRPDFNLYYTLWSTDYINQSHPELMDWFLDWMNVHFSSDIENYGLAPILCGYYATAFEFIVIGAALIEKGG
jgi:hypothetical protein